MNPERESIIPKLQKDDPRQPSKSEVSTTTLLKVIKIVLLCY